MDKRDVVLIRQLASDIEADGGTGFAHLLTKPPTRKLLGDRRLLNFIRGQPQWFQILDNTSSGSSGVCRIKMTPGWALALAEVRCNCTVFDRIDSSIVTRLDDTVQASSGRDRSKEATADLIIWSKWTACSLTSIRTLTLTIYDRQHPRMSHVRVVAPAFHLAHLSSSTSKGWMHQALH